MVSKINLSDIALPQEDLEVGGVWYTVTAMPATQGLVFMEQQQESLDTGKADLSLMKQLICKYVCKDGNPITDKSFDIIFARKLGHLRELYQAVVEYNFDDVFQEGAGEED